MGFELNFFLCICLALFFYFAIFFIVLLAPIHFHNFPCGILKFFFIAMPMFMTTLKTKHHTKLRGYSSHVQLVLDQPFHHSCTLPVEAADLY